MARSRYREDPSPVHPSARILQQSRVAHPGHDRLVDPPGLVAVENLAFHLPAADEHAETGHGNVVVQRKDVGALDLARVGVVEGLIDSDDSHAVGNVAGHPMVLDRQRHQPGRRARRAGRSGRQDRPRYRPLDHDEPVAQNLRRSTGQQRYPNNNHPHKCGSALGSSSHHRTSPVTTSRRSHPRHSTNGHLF